MSDSEDSTRTLVVLQQCLDNVVMRGGAIGASVVITYLDGTQTVIDGRGALCRGCHLTGDQCNPLH
jgi:hypothetical protein